MPPALVLYDHSDSTNALKVRFLLAELDLAVARVEVPLVGEKPPGYRKEVHPFGLVPALRVDDGLTITESNTALRFLAEYAGRADLRGEDLHVRARVDNALDSLSLELRPHLAALEEVSVYDVVVPEAELAARIAALTAALESYDRLLDPDGPYALGTTFTIVDAALAGRLLHLDRLPVDAVVAPRVRRALVAATARAAYAVAVGRGG